VKTIITRAGEGTKMVFTGDLQQIDQTVSGCSIQRIGLHD